MGSNINYRATFDIRHADTRTGGYDGKGWFHLTTHEVKGIEQAIDEVHKYANENGGNKSIRVLVRKWDTNGFHERFTYTYNKSFIGSDHPTKR